MDPTTSGQALTQLQGLQSQSQDPNAILASQDQSLGVNAAQSTVTGLRGAIDNTTKLLNQVAPSVMGRTGSSLVTNAQATKQISNEQAPISSKLTQEGTDYNNANSDLSNLRQQAQTAASGIYQGQQDKLSYAQNLYNSLYKQEQDAATAAETSREFNADLAEKVSEDNATNASNSGLASLLGGSSSAPTSSGAQAQQRSNGGFNFQDTNGNAISAAAYSQAKGIPIRTQLQNMANEGDAGAKTALNYVGNDYGVNMNKLRTLEVSPSTYNKTVSLLQALGFKV